MLSQACDRRVVLTYEDMIENWSLFARNLTRYIDLDANVRNQIYERSRPREKEDRTSHRRDGRPGGFRGQLQEETIEELNNIFKPVIERYQYKI